MTYFNATHERHVLPLDDLEVDAAGRDLRHASKLLIVRGLDIPTDEPLGTVALRLHEVRHCEVLEPVVEL